MKHEFDDLAYCIHCGCSMSRAEDFRQEECSEADLEHERERKANLKRKEPRQPAT